MSKGMTWDELRAKVVTLPLGDLIDKMCAHRRREEEYMRAEDFDCAAGQRKTAAVYRDEINTRFPVEKKDGASHA